MLSNPTHCCQQQCCRIAVDSNATLTATSISNVEFDVGNGHGHHASVFDHGAIIKLTSFLDGCKLLAECAFE